MMKQSYVDILLRMYEQNTIQLFTTGYDHFSSWYSAPFTLYVFLCSKEEVVKYDGKGEKREKGVGVDMIYIYIYTLFGSIQRNLPVSHRTAEKKTRIETVPRDVYRL